MGCHDLDIWLAAHLGDVFDKLALIPDDEERYVNRTDNSFTYPVSFDLSLRDYFLLEYADLLQTNPKHPALWRIISDYLAAAGDEGRARLRSHIVHVGLGLEKDPKGKGKVVRNEDGAAEGMDVEEEGEVETEFRHFTEVREACVELKLDEEWKMVATIMADRLVRRGAYGLAATMSLQAEDGYTLSRIAEKILDAYVLQGKFVSQVFPRSRLTETRRGRVPAACRHPPAESAQRGPPRAQRDAARRRRPPARSASAQRRLCLRLSSRLPLRV
jgi:nuclear pore complex protein Nup85